jgi:subtilisin-like proprotein convertase family protein
MIFMKNYLKHSLSLIALLGTCLTANAQVTMETYTFGGINTTIDATFGTIDSRSLASSITSITSVEVFLNITSTDFNSDLKVVLSHGANSSVLLNRVGRDTDPLANPILQAFGYNDKGFNITLSDSATYNDGTGDKSKDVHVYRAILYGNNSTPIPAPGILTGTFAPDGRATDGALATTADPRTALLSSFIGNDANGIWNLQLKDFFAPSETSTLVSWGMEISGVPEPQTYALAFGIGLIGVAMIRKRFIGNSI